VTAGSVIAARRVPRKLGGKVCARLARDISAVPTAVSATPSASAAIGHGCAPLLPA